ncbi:MAG: hypothetical protein EOO38_17195 [Cytophagaceae bacterium]|nr:MAG: hypothetical protein EOO38_17195 [Cytophagaceae bacterium]
MANKTLAGLKPNPKNPRKITDVKARMLRDSLARFGDISGLVFNRTSGQLVGGHQRVEAFKGLGASDVTITKAYKVASHAGTVAEGHVDISGERYAYREVEWDEATEKAANLAANKGAGEWDLAQVAEWIDELTEVSFDLDLTMFDADERQALAPEVEILPEVESEEPCTEVPDQTSIQIGDVYALGEHRLRCGNSADYNDVHALMAGDMAQLVFTDPPYNLAGNKNGNGAAIRDRIKRLMDSEWDMEFDFADVEGNLLAHCAEDVSVYICTSHHVAGKIWEWMRGWSKYNGYLVWSKSNPMPSLHKRHWTWNTELICYATRGKHTFNFPREGHALSTWDFAKIASSDLHPTMKPIEVPMRAITISSNKNDVVLDLFGGAGSTLLACEKVGRKCRIMEVDPKYCQVIIDRWQQATGQKAQLVSSGMADEVPDA